MVATKICKICLAEKELSEFHKTQSKCILCQALKDKEYRSINLAKIKNVAKQYRENNKEKAKQYRENNKEKTNKRQQKYRTKKKYDPNFKLKRGVSSSVRHALFKKGNRKNGSIKSKLPYTIDQLKAHLESKFEPWMNWDNWGVYNVKSWDDNDPKTWRWHIDHIIPQSKFNYTSMDDEEFRACWSLDNLRPYSAKLNVTEGDKR